MRLLHLSDLHFGKNLYEYSLLPDQRHWCGQLLEYLDRVPHDGVLIAGDLYDRSVPSGDAVDLCDWFLGELAGERRLPVLCIAGNHDSPQRLGFGSRLYRAGGLYMAARPQRRLERVTLRDQWGEVDVFLLPFVKPVHLRRCFPEETIESYTDAVRCAVAHMDLNPARRNVLVTHQFVTGAQRCESEELSVGGSDNVDASVFAPFDYVALGHIHGPQNVDGERVRYCGTPLKYSFSEARHQKSVTVAELGPKGNLTVRTVPLTPRRDMLELRGTYLEVSAREFYQNLDREAYIRVTLTDEEDVPDAMGKLRILYPNLMRLDYDNRRTRSGVEMLEAMEVEQQSPLELFASLYEQQNGGPMSPEQREYLTSLMEHVWEECE